MQGFYKKLSDILEVDNVKDSDIRLRRILQITDVKK